MKLVFLRKEEVATRPGPLDAEGGIVELEAALGFPAVNVVALVGEERIVLEDDETMREAARNEELASVLGRELAADGLAEGRRALADVDGDIPDGAADDADEFRLGVTACLPVETAQDAARGAAFVVLDEVGGDAGRGVADGVVGLDEIAARIAEDDGFDDLDVGNLG